MLIKTTTTVTAEFTNPDTGVVHSTLEFPDKLEYRLFLQVAEALAEYSEGPNRKVPAIKKMRSLCQEGLFKCERVGRNPDSDAWILGLMEAKRLVERDYDLEED